MLIQPVSPQLDGPCIESVDGVEPVGLRKALADLRDLTSERLAAGEEAPAELRRFAAARDVLVAELRAWMRPEKRHVLWAELRSVVVAAVRGGWLAGAAAEIGEGRLEEAPVAGIGKRWHELGALLLASPAWRLPAVPAFSEVADEWWQAYATWRFASPALFVAAGEAGRHAAHLEMGLEELARWVERNPGSATVLGAAGACVEQLDLSWLRASGHSPRAALVARGRIVHRLEGGKPGDHACLSLPREGRRLRLGVVAGHFAAGDATRRLLPLFAKLDPERFEVRLYALHEHGDAVEKHCRRHAARFEGLPADLSDRLAILRAAELDLVLFGGELDTRLDPLGRLALHRVAPLQLAASAFAPDGTGLPEIDLLLAGAADWVSEPEAAAALPERMGLLPGPTMLRDEDAAPESPTQEWSKDSLGLAAEALLFVSAADHRTITPETWELWASLLAAHPSASLLLQPFLQEHPVEAGARAVRFVRQCERAFGPHGIHPDRVIISTLDLANRADLRRLISVGDIYLDSLPGGDPESVLHALAAGLPVVGAGRGTAGLLRSLSAEELIARDLDACRALALRLAGDPAERARVAGRIRAAMERLPLCLDVLARSEAVGEVLERAYDELLVDGAPALRERRTPFLPTAIALDGPTRRALGLQALAAGRAARAVDYLLAAVQQDEGTPSLWLELARALSANAQKAEAVQALESALRLDEGLLEGWCLLADLAAEIGRHDLAAEAREVEAGLRRAASPQPASPQGLRLNLGGKLGRLRTGS